MATTTKNLKIPLLDGNKPFRTDTFNDAFQAIDENALAKSHAAEKSHWDLWQPNTAYKKQDVFRTTTIPSWGFWEVTKAGTSGATEPVGYGEDDTFTDGTCELILRRLAKGGGSTDVESVLDTIRNELAHRANVLLLADDGISPFIMRFAADDGTTFEMGKVWIGSSVPAGTAAWFETKGE